MRMAAMAARYYDTKQYGWSGKSKSRSTTYRLRDLAMNVVNLERRLHLDLRFRLVERLRVPLRFPPWHRPQPAIVVVRLLRPHLVVFSVP